MVTIDGPAGAGKSSIAKSLASHLGFLYVDSGAYYRSVALAARQDGIDWANPISLARFLPKIRLRLINSPQGLRLYRDDQEITTAIRTPEASRGASMVATVPTVRQWVRQQLRGRREKDNLIAEGRDMGTVVFPDAEVKIYLDASPEVRVQRRYRELQAQGTSVTVTEVQEDLLERDNRDQQRQEDPLRVAPGAHVINTSSYALADVVNICAALIQPLLPSSSHQP